MAYLQGAVYCWCKNCKDKDGSSKWFAVRDLFGGENYYWDGTPLMKIWEWHKDHKSEDPEGKAGIDAGHLMKKMLSKDKRSFNIRNGRSLEYQWNGRES